MDRIWVKIGISKIQIVLKSSDIIKCETSSQFCVS